MLEGVIAVAAFYVAMGLGANLETFGCAVASKSIKLKYAIIISAVVMFIAAISYGQNVSQTFRDMIYDYKNQENFILPVMFAVGIWYSICSIKGWPISTTTGMIGAIFGAAIIENIKVNLEVVTNVLISWLLSPIAGFIIAYFAYMAIKKIIINKINNFKKREIFERIISYIIIILSIFVIFEKTINDVSKAIAFIPYGDETARLIGAAGMAAGMLLIGKKILRNLGTKLTEISPSASLSTLISSLIVVSVANYFKMPISSTLVLVSGIVGSGVSMKRRINKSLFKEFLFSWFVTFPVCLVIAIIIALF